MVNITTHKDIFRVVFRQENSLVIKTGVNGFVTTKVIIRKGE